MPMHVALLRAVNVGGRNRLAMSDLRDLFGALGFAGAKSLLQSGNLVFRSDRLTGAALEGLLETETEERLHVAVDYFVRTGGQLQTIVDGNPFPQQAKRDPGHIVVMFLKKSPAAEDVKALEAAIRGREMVRSRGKELYIVYPDGIGRSKLTGTLIEKTLSLRGTARNWNTVVKLAAGAHA